MITTDFILSTIADGLFAAVAGTGFAIISNPPRKALLISAFLAFLGHSVRFFLTHFDLIQMNLASASTLAALTIGFFAIPFAMYIKCPAEVFAFPSLLPMVPGMFAYKAIIALIRMVQATSEADTSQYVVEFFHNGITTILVMFGLVVGAIIPIFIFHRQSFSITRPDKIK
jgi:uncharacterized membrane protein YjjB (DUF3815 family)